MKTNFTTLRNLILVTLLSVSFSTAFSQTPATESQAISNVTATVVNNNIVLNWNVTNELSASICEVQASKDGKNFTSIGIVMGADPKQNNNGFAFKQNLSKIKSGMVYFRIVTVGANANTSNAVKAAI